MPANREDIINFLLSAEGFTDAEKWIVKMQYKEVTKPSNFECKLWDLFCASDSDNLHRLIEAFPSKVGAFINWSSGTLGTRIRKVGLDI